MPETLSRGRAPAAAAAGKPPELLRNPSGILRNPTDILRCASTPPLVWGCIARLLPRPIGGRNSGSCRGSCGLRPSLQLELVAVSGFGFRASFGLRSSVFGFNPLLRLLRLLGALAFLDDLLLRLARHFFVMAEGLRMHAPPAGQRAQRAGIAVKLFGRHERLDQLEPAVHVHALDLAAPAGEVAHDFAHAIVRDADLDHVESAPAGRAAPSSKASLNAK